jgi:hypothetical protein
MIPLRTAIAIMAAAFTASVPAGAADHPNVIVFLIDDLVCADPGCYGNTFHETPH